VTKYKYIINAGSRWSLTSSQDFSHLAKNHDASRPCGILNSWTLLRIRLLFGKSFRADTRQAFLSLLWLFSSCIACIINNKMHFYEVLSTPLLLHAQQYISHRYYLGPPPGTSLTPCFGRVLIFASCCLHLVQYTNSVSLLPDSFAVEQ